MIMVAFVVDNIDNRWQYCSQYEQPDPSNNHDDSWRSGLCDPNIKDCRVYEGQQHTTNHVKNGRWIWGLFDSPHFFWNQGALEWSSCRGYRYEFLSRNVDSTFQFFFFFIISASLTSSRQRVVRFEKNLTADCQLGAAPALDKDKDESFVKPPAML